jgi:serine/threonine-protein kinase
VTGGEREPDSVDTTIPESGDVLVGKYRVDGVIGRGGMGVVLRATHLGLEQRVAIKLLVGDTAYSKKAQARFVREAQVAARIQSDHIARVSDVGHLPSGTAYIVMEYLEGENLAQLIARVGRLPVAVAVRYVLQACEALADAHRGGIVHRDLKPANLFLARRREGEIIKVLDFGISKVMPESPIQGEHDLTRTSALMGSPLYMAPEQMKSAKAADTRADVWAMGSILFELCTGVPPFVGTTLPEICSRILTEEPLSMADAIATVSGTQVIGEGGAPTPPPVTIPPGLEPAIRRCLDKNPETRMQTVLLLAESIAHHGGEEALRSAQVIRRILGGPADIPVEPNPLEAERPASPSVTSASPLAPVDVDRGAHESADTSGPVVRPFASTAAPITTTMPEGVPRRRAVVPIVALVGVLLVIAVLVKVYGWRDPQPSTAAASASSSATVASPVSVASESPSRTGPIGSASATGSVSRPPQPQPTPPASDGRQQPKPPNSEPVVVSPQPSSKAPTKGKRGDDLFSTHSP